MRVLEIGIAAAGEGAQQIERRGGLTVGVELALRVGHAGGRREIDAVDDVAAIARQLDVADALGGRGARLGELAGDATDLHHRRGGGEGGHDRHLQKHAKEIADVVGGMLGEGFGAIAALQQEGLARCDLAQQLLQLARLASEHERREARELALHLGQRGGIRIVRHLLDRQGSPALGGPGGSRHHALPRAGRSLPCPM